MADTTADGPAKASVSVEDEKVTPVLLTQREATDPNVKQGDTSDTSENLARDVAKKETEKVINSSIDIVERNFTQEVDTLANNLVKSTIDIVKSEHQLAGQKMSGVDKAETPDVSDTGRAKSCSELDDDVFEDLVYQEPVPDPYNKAISYLEKHNILQLFQGLTASIVYKRPEDPLEAMMNQLQLMKKSNLSMPPLTPSDQAVGGL